MRRGLFRCQRALPPSELEAGCARSSRAPRSSGRLHAHRGHLPSVRTARDVARLGRADAGGRVGWRAHRDPLEPRLAPRSQTALCSPFTAGLPNRPRRTETRTHAHNPLVPGSNPGGPIEKSPAQGFESGLLVSRALEAEPGEVEALV